MKFLILFSVLFNVATTFGQVDSTLDTINSTWLTNRNKPLAYDYVADRDILWSKIVWEYIDLSKELNYPYKYSKSNNRNQVNENTLFEVLVNGFNNDEILCYKDSFFNSKLSKKEVANRLVSVDTIPLLFDYKMFNDCIVKDVITTKILSKHIKGYKIKRMYYFDKHFSELRSRIIAIAPVSLPLDQLNSTVEYLDSDDLIALFWIHYPSIRKSLQDQIVFNNNFPITLDMLFTSKRYDSVIFMDENDFYKGNIVDNEYLNSFAILEKSNRIKDEIRDFELDMWYE